ncbi:MAG: DUF177 domain-containing protein [Burkholderiaceae bacterium]|nr:DUF177 domain-containing protein [Burkholderiaceae bacterium]
MSVRPVIDAFALAREREQRAGSVPLVRLSRLVEGLPEQAIGEAGLAHWSVQGETDILGRAFLRLQVRAQVTLICQRCMSPLVHPVESEVTLQLVEKESELDSEDFAEDEEIDPDAPEKVLGSQRFDLLEQVEDELVLCVPYVPRHEHCPDASSLRAPMQQDESAEDVPAKPSPFAVLARLKKD